MKFSKKMMKLSDNLITTDAQELLQSIVLLFFYCCHEPLVKFAVDVARPTSGFDIPTLVVDRVSIGRDLRRCIQSMITIVFNFESNEDAAIVRASNVLANLHDSDCENIVLPK